MPFTPTKARFMMSGLFKGLDSRFICSLVQRLRHPFGCLGRFYCLVLVVKFFCLSMINPRPKG